MALETITVNATDNGMRLDRWFATHYPDFGFGQLQKKCRKGEIRLDGKRVKTSDKVETGMQVRVPPFKVNPYKEQKIKPNPMVYNDADARYIRELVIHKDDGIIAINKPVGIAVQGGSAQQKHIDALTRYLHRENQDKPRLVHRLDKDTSGVLVLARSRQSATDLMQAFKGDKPKKVYWAVVVGEPDMDAGTIEAPLLKREGKAGEKVIVDKEEGKKAITEFQVLERFGGALTLLALYPRTGRTHQLRVHMAYMGTPILGDGKYGGKEAFVSEEKHMKKMHLHARLIQLPDTISGCDKNLTITADLPTHMQETFKQWGIIPAELNFDSVFENL